MQYMIVLYSDESQKPDFAPGSPEFNEMIEAWTAYNQMLIEGGNFISGAGLDTADTATVLTKSFDGSSTITDGPFVDTKEQLGGFYLVEAKDLDEALKLAKAVPIPVGSFEVRPVNFPAVGVDFG